MSSQTRTIAPPSARLGDGSGANLEEGAARRPPLVPGAFANRVGRVAQRPPKASPGLRTPGTLDVDSSTNSAPALTSPVSRLVEPNTAVTLPAPACAVGSDTRRSWPRACPYHPTTR